MSNLQSLEEITNNLGNMFSLSHPVTSVSIDINGKTAEQIKLELDVLSKDSEQNIAYINERTAELEKLAEESSDLTSTNNIQSAAQIIADIKKARSSIDASDETAKQLNNIYKRKLLSESGFESYEDVSTQIDTLSSQRSFLRQRFLGSLRFKSQIKDLSSRINSLYNLFNNQFGEVRIDEFGYSEKRRFKDAQGRLFRFANQVFNQYDQLASQLVRTHNEQKVVAPAIIESLTDDYVAKYFMSRIDAELEANQKLDNHYGKEKVAVLSDPALVDEALSVLRAGLNQRHYSDWNYSDEEKEKTKSLNDRLHALPYELKNIVIRGMIEGNKTTNDEFTEFADYLTQIPIDIQRRELLTSFSTIKEHVLSAISDEDLPYSITGQRWDLEKIASHIEGSLKPSEKSVFLKELDIKKWDVFRNNAGVREVYGAEALDSFNDLIRGEVFDRLLLTPENTDESVRLGYEALFFKDAKSVAYNLLNFWREPGYSGQQPFLSIHLSSENTLGAQYIASLTDEQLSAVEQLKIPGLMDVINNVRENPTTFRQSQFREGDDWVDNPVYERVQEALGKICGYYLEHGSEREKYFSIGVAVELPFMIYSDKSNDQRETLIEILSKNIGLEDNAQTNFRKHHRLFSRYIGSNSRRSTDLKEYKGDLVALSDYFDSLDDLLQISRYSERVNEEATSVQNDQNYLRNIRKDLPNLIAYLKGFDAEVVQTQLEDPEYGEKFKTKLVEVKEQIFLSNNSEIDDISAYIVSNFEEYRDFIDTTNEQIGESAVSDILKSELARLLDSLVNSDDLGKETAHISEYFRALDDNKTATRFTDMDVQKKINLEFLARIAYNCDESLVVPLTREAIRRNTSYEQQGQIQSYLPRIAEFSGFVDACVGGVGNQKELFDLLYELSIMGEDSFRLVSEIDKGNIEFNSVADSIKELSHSGVRSTSYLVESLVSSDDKGETIANWSKVMDSFAEGNFDSINKLHRNLEYTRFRSIVDHEKVRRHIKNHFTFTDYQSIFDRSEVTPESLMMEQDRFEIDCVAEEARMLRDYVLSVKQRADELGRDVFIVPNLSYGYLPVSPIIEELEHEGVNAIIGVKIGSTESHNNKEVVDSRLFKGYRTNLSNDQPIMVVVDGTNHLVARDDHDKAARYPDAYQGYLNQVIAMNDAMGFTDVDYSSAGKTSYDMSNLRNTTEFQRLVDVYSHVMKTDNPQKKRQPYQFGLWNTAGINLIIRNYHQKIGHVTPTTPKDIEGPAMVFCNVGLLDEQIPAELKERYKGLTHTPAYFDDSGKIINFDFGFDNFGVRYLNTLETEIKKSFGSMHSKLSNGDFVSSLIRYVQNNPAQPVGYEA